MRRFSVQDTILWENGGAAQACAADCPPDLNPDVIADALTTDWWGRRCVVADTVSSSIDVAKALLQDGTPSGTLVLANHQSGGRGRQGSRWESPRGKDLLLTFVVQEEAPMPTALLSLYSTAAVAGALDQRHAVPARLKWPNDLYLEGRKLAGSLVERVDGHVLVSLGLNVNTMPDDHHPSMREQAVSLAEWSGRFFNRAEVLVSLGTEWERIGDQWRACGSQPLRELWARYSLLQGQPVSFHYQGHVRQGLVTGLDEEGALQVQHQDGSVRAWQSEHIRHIRLQVSMDSRTATGNEAYPR